MIRGLVSISVLIVSLLIISEGVVAADFGPIGQNPGLDFYSRIDDAGDALARQITTKRVSQYPRLMHLGCQLPQWLAIEPTAGSEPLLGQLQVGNYELLIQLARKWNINLDTNTIHTLSTCLAEKYTELQKQARQDQTTLEIVSQVGIFTDGDTANSDYDILDDIKKINSIIFKKELKYDGVINQSPLRIRNYLTPRPREDITYPDLQNPTTTTTTIQTLVTNTIENANQTPGVSATTTTSSGGTSGYDITNTVTQSGAITQSGYILISTLSGSTQPPWASMCTPDMTTSGSHVGISSGITFDDGFIRDLNTTIRNGGLGTPGVVVRNTTSGTTTTEVITTTIPSITDNNPQGPTSPVTYTAQVIRPPLLGTTPDFFHSHPCVDQIFCLKVNMVPGSQKLLGGGNNVSIESLLEKHIDMVDPISWSDLSAQKMTNNSYQLPFLNIKFPNKIAGARVFVSDAPQPSRNLQKEQTPESLDEAYKAAYRCAMNTAGLLSDATKVNGFPGAGYISYQGLNTGDTRAIEMPLSSQEVQPLAECHLMRFEQGRKTNFNSFSTDLNELQAFTQAMLNVIFQITDTDRKLDKIPSK